MSHLLRVVGLAAVSALGFAPSAVAFTGSGSTTVSGTTAGSLSISAPAAAALGAGGAAGAAFAPGQTPTSAASTLGVQSTGDFSLTVRDAAMGTTPPGHLHASSSVSACSSGTQFLAQPLTVIVDPGGGQMMPSINLSGTDQAVLADSFSHDYSVTYSQPIGATEQIHTGCVYQTTVTYTVTGAL